MRILESLSARVHEQPEVVEGLVQQYLASIPVISEPVPRPLASITPLPFSFPDGIVVQEVRCVPADLAAFTIPQFKQCCVWTPHLQHVGFLDNIQAHFK